MAVDPTSMAVKLGFSALGKIFGSKGKSRKATPEDYAKQSLSASGFKTSSIGMSQPSTGRSAKSAASAEMYDWVKCGSVKCGRARATISARPAATIVLTWSGVVMLPTAMVGTPASKRTCSDKCVWNIRP